MAFQQLNAHQYEACCVIRIGSNLRSRNMHQLRAHIEYIYTYLFISNAL